MTVIYSFLDTKMLVRIISKLSKRHRKILISKDSEVLIQRGSLKIDGRKLLNLLEEGQLNSEQFEKSVEYLISITNGIDLRNSKVIFDKSWELY